MNVRTSITDPISIHELPCGAGSLGLTFCPGKKGASVYGPAWDRDLGLDLAAVREWGAKTVVTLMEAHELEMLKVPDLGTQTEALGMEWFCLPIVDVNVPDERFEQRWTYYGHLLRSRLRDGHKIVLHCRGGRGRTGLIAARLLVEFGCDPDEAIRTVRKVRDGAIETWHQEENVLSTQSIGNDSIARAHNELYRGKVLGCLLGGAIGDGFGYAVEFDRLDAIRRRYGPAGIVQPSYSDGRLVVSDDTQMTLFTAEGLIEALRCGTDVPDNEVMESVFASYLNWLETQSGRFNARGRTGLLTYEPLWAPRAPGNTCVSALGTGVAGTVENRINNSKGCGGVMRAAPFGLVRSIGADRAFSLGAQAAALTHGHPSGYLSAGFLSSLIAELVSGKDIWTGVDDARDRLIEWADHEELLLSVDTAIDLAKLGSTNHDANLRRLGQGWVGEEALAIALYSVFASEGFCDAIRIAANHDGDSDSTASIAGQIWGAAVGIEDIPVAWAQKLDVLDPTCDIACKIVEIG